MKIDREKFNTNKQRRVYSIKVNLGCLIIFCINFTISSLNKQRADYLLILKRPKCPKLKYLRNIKLIDETGNLYEILLGTKNMPFYLFMLNRRSYNS